MKKFKVAVIGCGNIAHGGHIPAYMALKEEAEIKYFCDIIKEKADKCVEQYGCGTAIQDYRDALSDPEIDAVSVCVPNYMHSVIAIDAMRAGKHVLCEKPAARTYAEALEMQRVQHETGVVLNIGVVTRFHKGVEAVRRLIESGELGRIYHVFINFRSHRSIPGIGGAFTTKELSGGGVLIDWGVHRIDQVLYMVGDPEPVSVSAAVFSELGRDIPEYHYRSMWSEDTRDVNGTFDVDESCTALVRTTGPVISLEGAWAQNIEEDEQYLDFMGTKAGVRLTYCGGYKLYTYKDGEFKKEEPELENGSMFTDEIAAFFDCIRTGKKARSHIDYAIKTSMILQGAYDSSDKGREVVFADYEK